MSKPVSGKMEPVDVRVEVYDLSWDVEDQTQVDDFHADPEAFMRRFLVEQGYEVNRIDFLIRGEGTDDRGKPSASLASSDRTAQRMPERNFHIVYPDNEASGWICCC